jgi:D-alanyl-lipoteichoic acid acyltransferase DltB (MBOAT superfamily)
VASAYFYASFIPIYLLILGFIILVDYSAGIWIERTESRSGRKWILILSLITNLSFLAFFKYFDFFHSNFSALLQFSGAKSETQHFSQLFPDLILPIGLSFHTFQSMSYTIEVYRKNQKAEYNLGIYSLYVLFYPQLVAGPIERPQNILWQFRKKILYDADNMRAGLWLIASGMFKKVVIADRLSMVSDSAFANSGDQNATSLLIAIVFYSFQIYCDFSGYSDIAIGTARTMGIKLMVNFNAPYFATSIADFWKRWHISLSTWFRDYVYIPMGGNRAGLSRMCLNLMLVFLLSGLWHGPDWKFIVWGGLHGAYLILGRIFSSGFPGQVAAPGLVANFVKAFHIVWTFALVTFAWIFFRADSTGEAIKIIQTIATPSAYSAPVLSVNNLEFIFCLILIILLLCKDHYMQDYVPGKLTFWPSFVTISLLCYLFGVFDSNQFIYFQF